MKPLKIVLPILLIGAGVVGISVYRYSKPSAVPASPAPRVAVKDEGKTINLAASGKGEGGTKATSTLQAFRDRIMKAKGEKNRAKRMALLSEAVQSLDPFQIKEALAEVEAMDDDQFQFRTRLRSMLLSRWGGSDPKAALAYAQELVLRGEIVIYDPTTRDFRIAHFSMTPLFDSWLKKDFSAAKAWVEGLPADSWFRKGLLPSLAFDMAQKDPVAALNLARSLSGVERESFLSGAIDGWSLKDADAAIAYVGQLPASQNKISIIESMIGTLASKNPDKAINLLAAIPPGDVQNQALSKIANAWTQSDPKAAIDWANQQTNPELKSQILEGVISGMAKKDPNAALELAQLLTKGDDSRENISNILSDLAESDPKGAVDYAMNLPSSKNRNMMIGNLAGQWITVDPEGALGWYASLTDPNLKGRVAVSMIVNLSPVDPDRAIDLLETIPPGDVQNEALSTIGYYWDRTDQNAALDWANQQIDPEVKSRILEGVIAGMSAKNPNSAFQLAQSLPAGNSRNKSINLSLGSMAQSDPQSAIGLASGIADADLRSKAQQNIVLIWKRRDPAAATQWVNSSTLPQDVKASLLKQK